MWEIFVTIIVIIVIAFLCYTQNDRKIVPSLFLGLTAGIVVLFMTQKSATIALPTKAEIGSKAVLYMSVAIDIALGVYLALTHARRGQIVIEPNT